MPRGNVASTAGGMLSDLKSRLGFSRDEDIFEDYDEYDDDYDDYDARDDGGYADRDLDRDRGASSPSAGYRPTTTRSSRFGHSDSTPNLVSIDDVKARSRATDEGYSSRRGERNLVENSGPAEYSPAYNAAMKEREREREEARNAGSRSGGLDSLFEPSTGGSSRSAGSYDPYEAYASSKPSTYSTTRGLTVVKPAEYGDVERVSRALKAGDAVVLALHATPDALSKRVLDFSFGVASALDANVECPAEKVFAIARGMALSEDEKRSLRSQGVIR